MFTRILGLDLLSFIRNSKGNNLTRFSEKKVEGTLDI